jgi:dUTP pyrophosphatase
MNEFGDDIESFFDDDIVNQDYEKIAEEYGFDIRELDKEMRNYKPTMDIRYSKSNLDAVSPKYAYPTDSGFDLFSTEEVEIVPFGRKLIPTGLHFDIPDGYEIQVRSKSGLALKQGLMVLNSPGTVDQGYTGEIKVIIFNVNSLPVTIEKGQKIAQAVVSPVVCGKWLNMKEVSSITDKDRSDKGFGSTGI